MSPMDARNDLSGGGDEISLAREPDFLLGPLRVSPSTREVHWSGGVEAVQPRVMQVLVCLARAGGGVVSRDDLFRRCWGGRIVGEDAINRCIGAIRQIAELGGAPAFTVETIPRVGYRLKRLTNGAAAHVDPSLAEPPGPSQAAPSPKSTPGRAVIIVMAAVVLIAGGAAVLWSRLAPLQELPPLRTVAVLPTNNLTDDPSLDATADSLTEDVTAVLGRGGFVSAAPRNAVFAFKGKPTDERLVGKVLHVRNVVTSSLRKADPGYRVSFQIVDTATGQVIHAGDIGRAARDGAPPESQLALALYEPIAQAIDQRWTDEELAKSPNDNDLESVLARAEKLIEEDKPRDRPETERLIARGRVLAPKTNALRARLESDSCDYYDGLLRTGYDASAAQRAAWAQAALDAGAEATDLMPNMTSPHGCRADVFGLLGRWDEGEAEAHYVISRIRLTMSGYEALANLALARGRFHDALNDYSELTERTGMAIKEIGLTYLLLGDYRQAIWGLREQVVLDSRASWPHFFLSAALELSGRHDQALAEAAIYRTLRTDDRAWRTLALSHEPAFLKRADIIRGALRKVGLNDPWPGHAGASR
jgi:DNA-binding winged helix-turn-helix (wHTH) protein/TolB-like protein